MLCIDYSNVINFKLRVQVIIRHFSPFNYKIASKTTVKEANVVTGVIRAK